LKKSFSMIELIFAIIVIALAIGAIPSIVRQVEDSTNLSINQEAIWMASSVMYNILDYQWDENNTKYPYVKALDVSNGDSDLNRVINTRYRIGHIIGNSRRSFYNKDLLFYPSYPITPLGTDAGESITYSPTILTNIDDMDDFNGYNGSLSQGSSSIGGESAIGRLTYKKDYNMRIGVKYIADSPVSGDTYRNSNVVTFKLNPNLSTTGSTNIKFIELNVTNCDSGGLAFRLQAFSSNIGEYLDLMNKE
jgi:hypothetical protein